ncbi:MULTISPECIES: RNA polymerase sigma factor [Stenotrophomonas]|uniref:RNA polymerase sigma 70 n=1 Tax=Stenotrophomonas nitritireducens TaxID=83617 RepID=A0ABR5NN10_9GAMM|nr:MULTISPECIES: sigma-70 family RNA polymerase sigma factor [Stenotrophomonas]KQO02259.1 RNA polymerase subunit sigma-70 [Stenotrophomonas sp. Leaf70]KRG59944.1 RNA polymerase sigma 70 [Stenotrophomonas nitritireducens]MBN8769568.1 sigma-70 family RNA polymerase sigma factor [Stenotrophomonas sp.]MBN8793937.1 sigma-70 family RNA polymerase sigma factor [Stenotrophomonas nitritireducens]
MAPSQPLPEPPARFTELLQRHRGILVKVAGSYARQREDREDLAQEIAAQLWRAWPGYDPARPFSTWMYRIALNVAISQLRGRARTPTLQAAADDPLDTLPDPAAHDPDRAQQVERLYRFIHALPPLDRALMLLHLEECPQREIAEVLGLSATNVATKIGRLKARLRNEL